MCFTYSTASPPDTTSEQVVVNSFVMHCTSVEAKIKQAQCNLNTGSDIMLKLKIAMSINYKVDNLTAE